MCKIALKGAIQRDQRGNAAVSFGFSNDTTVIKLPWVMRQQITGATFDPRQLAVMRFELLKLVRDESQVFVTLGGVENAKRLRFHSRHDHRVAVEEQSHSSDALFRDGIARLLAVAPLIPFEEIRKDVRVEGDQHRGRSECVFNPPRGGLH